MEEIRSRFDLSILMLYHVQKKFNGCTLFQVAVHLHPPKPIRVHAHIHPQKNRNQYDNVARQGDFGVQYFHRPQIYKPPFKLCPIAGSHLGWEMWEFGDLVGPIHTPQKNWCHIYIKLHQFFCIEAFVKEDNYKNSPRAPLLCSLGI